MNKSLELRPTPRATILSWAVAAAVLVPAASAVQAQKFPDRPLRIITGFLPGGVSDTIARVLGDQLSTALGERVVVDGRPGAGGMVSMEIAAKATPDGHTIYLAQPVVSIAAAIDKYPWDPIKAFSPVGMIGISMTLLAANPSFPAGNPKEFIAYAQANPGKINYGSSGFGGPNHIAAELLQVMAKFQMNHVPYKGAGATVPAVIAGEVPVAVMPLLGGLPHLKAGRIRAIGVTGARRTAAAPDIPAFNETVPGFSYQSWFGFVLPAGAPRPVVMRLNTELNRILTNPDTREKLTSQGVDTETSTPEQLGRVMADDVVALRKLIKATGLKLN